MVFLHSKTFQLILPSQALLFNSSVRCHASYLRQLEQSFVALYCKHLSSAAQSSPTKHSFLQTGSKDKGSLYLPPGLGLLCHPGTESLDSTRCKPFIKFISKTNHKYLESWCCSSDTLQCCRNCHIKTSPPPDSQLFAVVLYKPQEGTKHKQKAQAPSLAAPCTSLASLTGSVSMKNIHSSE